MVRTEPLRPTFAPKDSFSLRRAFTGPTSVIIIAFVYLVMFAYNVQVILDRPQLDLMLDVSQQGDATITLLTAGGVMWHHGVRVGDRVLIVDGRAPHAGDAGFWFGQRVLIQTRSQELVALHAGMLPSGHRAWPLLLLSPWFFLFGILIYNRAQNRAIAGSTFALFTSIAFAMAMGPAAVEDRLFVTAIEFVAVTLFAPCFLHFLLVFPTTHGSPGGRTAIFILPLIVSLLGLLSSWYASVYELAALLRLIILLGYISIGILMILYTLIIKRSVHSGVAIIGVGTVISVLPFLGLYLIPVLFLAHPLLPAEYAILSLALLPMSFTYSILRHQVLNIALIQRWLIHGLLYAVMVIFYTFILVKIATLWFDAFVDIPIVVAGVSALVVIIIGMTFQWFYKRTCQLLDHVFFKDSYDYHSVLQDMSRGLSIVRDIDTLGVQLLRTFWELVNVEFAALMLRDQHNQSSLYLHAIAGVGNPELLVKLTKLETIFPDISTITSLSINSQSILAVPLRVHDFTVGYICLGPKVKGEPFRTQDRDLLNTLSVQIAAIIRNTQLVNDLRTKVQTLNALNDRLQRVQEQERARLAADIHDESLQTAMHLQRQLAATLANDDRIASIVPLSQTLIDQLRNVCTSMRPTALDDLGLIAALDTLAQEQSDRCGVPIFLDVDPATSELVFNPNIELVLYRAAQEAVNNSLRHARPKSIHIHLCQNDGLVQLTVTDNGQGFDVPDQLDALVSQGHLGLIGMHERVQHIGGLLGISSTPGEGTVVRLLIPLEWSPNDSGDAGR